MNPDPMSYSATEQGCLTGYGLRYRPAAAARVIKITRVFHLFASSYGGVSPDFLLRFSEADPTRTSFLNYFCYHFIKI